MDGRRKAGKSIFDFEPIGLVVWRGWFRLCLGSALKRWLRSWPRSQLRSSAEAKFRAGIRLVVEWKCHPDFACLKAVELLRRRSCLECFAMSVFCYRSQESDQFRRKLQKPHIYLLYLLLPTSMCRVLPCILFPRISF